MLPPPAYDNHNGNKRSYLQTPPDLLQGRLSLSLICDIVGVSFGNRRWSLSDGLAQSASVILLLYESSTNDSETNYDAEKDQFRIPFWSHWLRMASFFYISAYASEAAMPFLSFHLDLETQRLTIKVLRLQSYASGFSPTHRNRITLSEHEVTRSPTRTSVTELLKVREDLSFCPEFQHIVDPSNPRRGRVVKPLRSWIIIIMIMWTALTTMESRARLHMHSSTASF